MPLFDYANPDAVQQALEEKARMQDIQQAQMPAGRGMVQSASQAGRMLGGALFKQPEDPAVKKARDLQNAMNETKMLAESRGISLAKDPHSFYDVAIETMNKHGLTSEAAAAAKEKEDYKRFERGELPGGGITSKNILTGQENVLAGAGGMSGKDVQIIADEKTGDKWLVHRATGQKIRKVLEGGKLEKEERTRVEKLQKEVAKSGYPRADVILKRVEKLLYDPYGEGKDAEGPLVDRETGNVLEGADIRGVGGAGIGIPWTNIAIPVTGGAHAPSWGIGKRGRALRQYVSKLKNIELKDRSGAAVTVPEFDRFLKEWGQYGLIQNDQDFVNAIRAYREEVEAAYEQIKAGQPADVVQQYIENTRADRIKNYLPQDSGAEESYEAKRKRLLGK